MKRGAVRGVALGVALASGLATAAGSRILGGDVFTLGGPDRGLKEGRLSSHFSLRDITDQRHLAELGLVSAEFNLGVMYSVNERYSAALYWYRKAALRGHREASYNLGTLYRNGQGVARDDAQAERWFGMAAERGLPQAQYQLGRLCYERRASASRDPDCERASYQQAAESGYPLAQHDLAVLYHLGEGVAPDPVEAYAWFSAADASGFDCRDALAVVAAALTPEQMAAAKTLAGRYRELYVQR